MIRFRPVLLPVSWKGVSQSLMSILCEERVPNFIPGIGYRQLLRGNRQSLQYASSKLMLPGNAKYFTVKVRLWRSKTLRMLWSPLAESCVCLGLPTSTTTWPDRQITALHPGSSSILALMTLCHWDIRRLNVHPHPHLN